MPSGATKGNPVETIEPEVTIEEQAEAAEAFTQGLVDAFDLGAQVRSVIVDEGIVVDVTGESLGLLVGPRGATLNAIEELVRTVVQRQTDGHGVRINVDVAGYRAKRREALEEFTRGIAERVLETGRSQALEPMSALDRKVVHDTASEIDGVATESEGEEPRRRVVLDPGGGRARRLLIGSQVDRDTLLVEILQDARACGFLGPEPVEHHIEHSRDLADAVGPFRGTFLDLGSGGGVPGLVLAMSWPDADGILLESQRRRCELPRAGARAPRARVLGSPFAKVGPRISHATRS